MSGRDLWSADELDTSLEAAADTRLEAAWHLLATARMRFGEVLALRWADVDAATGRITVRNAVVGVAYADLAVPPTAMSRRAIDALPLLGVLDRHRCRQDAERSEWGAYYHDADLVICRQNGRPLHPRDLHRAFKKIVGAVGLPTIRLSDLHRSCRHVTRRTGVGS